MRGWAGFALFGFLLIGSLAVRETAIDLWAADDDTLEQAIIRVAETQGLTFRGPTGITYVDIRTITFSAPDCSGPVLVVLLVPTFEQEPILRTARGPDQTRRYVYLDRSWDSPHPLAVFFERAKFAALATVGLTRYVPSRQLLLVEAPSGCKAADDVDWRPVWDRRMLQTLKADAAG